MRKEDDDALYMVNDPVPLSDPYLRDVLKLICHADYKLGTQDQPPHFIWQDGEGISFSDMVEKLKLRDWGNTDIEVVVPENTNECL